MPWVEPIARRAAWITIAGVIVAFLSLAKSFVIPIALALLFAFLLSPVVAKLHHYFRSRVLAVVVSCGVAFSAVAGAGFVVGHQLLDFADELPTYQHTIAQKIIALRGSNEGTVARLTHALNDINREVASSTTQPSAQSAAAHPMAVLASTSSENLLPLGDIAQYVSPLLEPATLFFIVCILVVLLLVNGEDLRDRVIVMAGTQQVSITTQALEEASEKIGRYLLMQAVINASFGVFIATGLFFIGIPNALLLGLLAGVMRFIPVVGVWCAALLPAALAIAVFDHWAPLFYVGALFAFAEACMNFAVEPWLYGLSTGISGVAVLIAILFWTWIWGPLGLLLAVPITVCLVVLGKHLEPLHVFYILLGDEPVLAGDTRLYHRLVAGDLISAERIVDLATREMGETRVCDELLLPVLQTARSDLDRGNISEEKFNFVNDALSEFGTAVPSADAVASAIIACVGVQKGDSVATQILAKTLGHTIKEAVAVLPSSIMSELIARIEEGKIAVLILVTTSGDSIARSRLLAKALASKSVQVRIFIADLGRVAQHFTQDSASGPLVIDNVTQIAERVEQLVRERIPVDEHPSIDAAPPALANR